MRNKYARNKIECKCKKCGHIWETAASELLKGTRCPVCQIKAVGEIEKAKKQYTQAISVLKSFENDFETNYTHSKYDPKKIKELEDKLNSI